MRHGAARSWWPAPGVIEYQCHCGLSYGESNAFQVHCDRENMRDAWRPSPEPSRGAELSQLKAEMEAAIEQARTEGRVEGRLDALDEAAAVAQREADDYASTWGENSAGDKALRRIAQWASERINAHKREDWS